MSFPKIFSKNAILGWSVTKDYSPGEICRGGGSVLYSSKLASGPSTTAGSIDPTIDDGTYWTRVSIDDSGNVHKTNDEVIGGNKTFTGGYNSELTRQSTQIIFAAGDLSLSEDETFPASRPTASIQFTDKYGDPSNFVTNRFGYIDALAPSQSDDSFTVGLFTPGSVNYLGKSYGGGVMGTLAIKMYPNTAPMVDTYHLMTSANHPYLAFRNANAPNKGTLPTSNMYSTIVFGDNHPAKLFGDASAYYGSISSVVRSDGATFMFINTYKNVANGTADLGVVLEYNADDTSAFRPSSSNKLSLGKSNMLWTTVYAKTSTINTSDARLKTKPEPFPDAVLDAWGDVNFVQFQLLDSVEEKGSDKARLHSGLIAQNIDQAFSKHNLDASRYGLFCYDEWDAEPEELDENGGRIREAQPAGNQYSLRYEEALCMEAAYQRRQNSRTESRFLDLEQRIALLEEKIKQEG